MARAGALLSATAISHAGPAPASFRWDRVPIDEEIPNDYFLESDRQPYIDTDTDTDTAADTDAGGSGSWEQNKRYLDSVPRAAKTRLNFKDTAVVQYRGGIIGLERKYVFFQPERVCYSRAQGICRGGTKRQRGRTSLSLFQCEGRGRERPKAGTWIFND
jgi:hypothetical protein